jgi:GABA(A) receptor-associated protein
MSNFKKEFSLEQRSEESSKVLTKYPTRIPVIVEKDDRSTVNTIDKKKYLVPGDLTIGQFIYIIRKRIKLKPEEALFVFTNNTLVPTSALISTVYESNKDQDKFLYFKYTGENTFG